jgi:hypothetical protein
MVPPTRSFLRLGVGGNLSRRRQGSQTERHASGGVGNALPGGQTLAPPAAPALAIARLAIEHTP